MFRLAKFFRSHVGSYLSKVIPIYQRPIMFRWPQYSFSTNFPESKQPDQVWSSLIVNNTRILEQAVSLAKDPTEEEAANFRELLEKVSSTQDLALWTKDEILMLIALICSVATDHFHKGNFLETLEICSQASVLLQTFGFENNYWNLYNLSNLASTNFKLGNYDAAEAYTDEIISNVPKIVDLEDGAIALYNTLCQKGEINLIKDQPDKALKAFNEALEQVENLKVEYLPYYLAKVYDFLGKANQALNQPQTMIQDFQKGLARVIQLEGEDGCYTGYIYQGLAQALNFASRHEEAMLYMQKAYKIFVKSYGEDSYQATGTLSAKIDLYFFLEQYDKCIELSRHLEKYLSDPEQIGELSMILMSSYAHRYDYKKAKQYLTQAIEKYSEVCGEDIYPLASCYFRYAELLNATRNKEYMPEARDMYEKAYAIYSQFNDTHSMAHLLSVIAEVNVFEGKTEEAIETFHKCLDQYQHGQSFQKRALDSQFWLCLLYSQEQKYTQAVEHGEKALEMAKINGIDDDEFMTTVYHGLGKAYEGAKMLKKSEEAFQEMLKISYEKFGKDHWLVTTANLNLIQVMLQLNETEKRDKPQQKFKSRQ